MIATIVTSNHKFIDSGYALGMDEMDLFRKNLRELIARNGYTMVEVERRSGLSRTHVKLVLDGDREITIKRAAMLAKAFGLSVTDMLKESLPSDEVAREDSLLRVFRALSHESQDALDQIARQLPQSPPES